MIKDEESDEIHNELPPEIFQHWGHSHEEDTEYAEVYRPHTYNFPVARGRTGFDIKKNGEFIQYDIGPACGTETVMGHWEAEGTDKIKVYLESTSERAFTLSIVSCDEDMLKIEK